MEEHVPEVVGYDHSWQGVARHQGERHFRQLLEKLPAGAYTCDADGLITYYNRHAAQIWGREPRLNDPGERFCGSHRLFTADGAPLAHEACWMALSLRTGAEYDGCEVVIERPDGQRAIALAHASPIHDEDGAIIGAVNVLVDISAHRKAEEERRRFEAQLLAAQKLESLGVLAGGIAHDFNNLLTTVLGYVSLAALELPPDSRPGAMLEQIEAAAQRAADLAQQMLAYSGRGAILREPFRLDDMVRRLSRLLETITAKTARLELELEPAVIDGDESQLGQVIVNLVANAAEACAGQRGLVVVRAGVRQIDAAELAGSLFPAALAPGAHAFIEVVDDGCGMSAEALGRIFEPFYSTKLTGRGLGLAAVLGIVKGHRGTMSVRSAPGGGTRVVALFPLAAALGAEPVGPPAPEPARAPGAVLLIDDEESIRTLARRVLEREGTAVIEAGDGPEGLRIFSERQGEIGAAVVDLTLPGLGGLEVVEGLRRIRPDLPVLLISGYSDQKLAAGAEGRRLQAFLQKPFRPSELLERLRQLQRGLG